MSSAGKRLKKELKKMIKEEWLVYAKKPLDEVKKAIWEPTVFGPWRPSQDVIRRFIWTDAVVCDYGCGIGRNIPALLEAGCSHIYAIDSVDMIEHAKALCPPDPRIEFVDVEKRSSIGRVGFMFCSLVLQHMPPDVLTNALDWIYDTLEDKGTLIVYGRDTLDPDNPIPLHGFIEKRFIPIYRDHVETGDSFPHSLRTYRKRS